MSLLSEKAKALKPYTAGEQPQDKSYIKLNTNENPYPPTPEIYRALGDMDFSGLKLYPDPKSNALRTAIAKYESCSPCNVFCGNGSDEILSFAFGAFFGGKPVYFADITYSFYPVYCDFYGIPYKTVPVRADFSLDVDGHCGVDGSGVVIANPNAPTSLAIPLEAVERVAASNLERVVLIDEAYVDFFGMSAAGLTKKYDNLLVVKTLSKSYSMAGLRVGYAIGSPVLIDALERMKDSFNSYPVDRIAERLAIAAIEDTDYHDKCVKAVADTRDKTIASMRKLGFNVLESKSNFLFASHTKIGGRELYQALKDRGILVRHFDKPGINAYLRISVGSPSEMRSLISALKAILSEK